MSNQLSLRDALDSAGKAYNQNILLFASITIFPLAIDDGLSNLASRFTVGAFILPIGQLALWTLTSIILCAASLIALKNTKVSIDSIRSELTATIFWQMLLANLVFTVGMFAGMLLLIIPGILFCLSFAFYQFILINEKTTAIESLKRSFKLTKNHRLKLFLITLAIFVPFLLLSIVMELVDFSTSKYVLGLYVNMAVIVFAHFYRELLHAKITPEAPCGSRN